MTECCRAECTLYRVYVHYITARSLNRRDRRGDLRCKADRATREGETRGETVEDCETGQTWRLASGESLTQHWLLLTQKASETGRLSVSGQVLPSRSHFIVECLLLPTALFASLSLSLSRLFCCASAQPLTLSAMGRTQRLAATPSIRLDAVADKFT